MGYSTTGELSGNTGQVDKNMTETIEIPKKILVDLVDLWNKKHYKNYGSPNHSHLIPGVWDSDNGELAGKPCAECALYDEFRRLINDA